MRTQATEQMQYAPAATAATISNGDATVAELDRSLFGWPTTVSLVFITGTVASTAVIDTFSVHGAADGPVTPSQNNLLKAHPPVPASVGGNSDKVFKITVDLSARGDIKVLDAIISNNVAANLPIVASWWEMSNPKQIPPTNANFGAGSPTI